MMEATVLTAALVSCWRSGCCSRASFRFIITLVSWLVWPRLCRFLKKVLLAAEVAKLQTFFTEVEVQMPGLKKYFSKVLMQLFYLSYQIAITCLNAATNNSHYAHSWTGHRTWLVSFTNLCNICFRVWLKRPVRPVWGWYGDLTLIKLA